jgi:hypothetical protein
MQLVEGDHSQPLLQRVMPPALTAQDYERQPDVSSSISQPAGAPPLIRECVSTARLRGATTMAGAATVTVTVSATTTGNVTSTAAAAAVATRPAACAGSPSTRHVILQGCPARTCSKAILCKYKYLQGVSLTSRG